MNPLDWPKKTLCCLCSTLVLWLLLAFGGQYLLLGLTPQDSGFYPTAAALTYSFYALAAICFVALTFAIFHYSRTQRTSNAFHPLSYDLNN